MSKYRICELDEQVAQHCMAVANARRTLLLHILSGGERTVSQLGELTGFSLPNVSQHLKLLRDRGMVKARRNGGQTIYRLAQPKVMQAVRIMRQVVEEWRKLTHATPAPQPQETNPGEPNP